MTKNKTAKSLLSVMFLLMRDISSQMRQSENALSPSHVGILNKVKDQPCSMSELAEHLFVKLPTMSRSVGLLVDLGLVKRVTPKENRRQIMVCVTNKGSEALKLMQKDVTKHTVNLLSKLNNEELEVVGQAFTLLEGTLEEHRQH